MNEDICLGTPDKSVINTNMALMINILEIGLASIEYSHTMYYIVSLDKSSLPVLAFYG